MVLDAELLRVGSRVVVWERSISTHVKELREVQDERLAILLEIATVGLIVGAILLVVLAWILAASRKRRNDVARLCEGVEKLRDPKGPFPR